MTKATAQMGGLTVKRWPVIRHARYVYLSWHFWRWWRHQGRYLGAAPNESDIKYLESVWKGKA